MTIKKTYGINLALLASILGNLFFVGNYFLKKHQHHVQARETANKISYAFNRQTIFALLPITNNDIVIAGDSHTQFFKAGEYMPGHSIKTRGIYSDVTAGLLNRMNQITNGHPKKIFLEIGFNDITDEISPDSSCTNIRLIIKQIRQQSPDTKIYINSIFPSSVTDGVDYISLVPELNDKIKSICTDNKITYIDVYSKLSANGILNKSYDCGDGIHLNGKGYLAWSNVLKPYL